MQSDQTIGLAALQLQAELGDSIGEGKSGSTGVDPENKSTSASEFVAKLSMALSLYLPKTIIQDQVYSLSHQRHCLFVFMCFCFCFFNLFYD